MAKPIEFTYNGTDYRLEFSKAALKSMSDEGFDVSYLNGGDPAKQAEMVGLMWKGSFYKNHRTVKKSVIEEIYSKMPNKSELLVRLSELYLEPIAAMTKEPEEGEAIRWE